MLPPPEGYKLDDFIVGDEVMFKMEHVPDYGTWWVVTGKHEKCLMLKTNFPAVPKDERFIEPRYVIMRGRP